MHTFVIEENPIECLPARLLQSGAIPYSIISQLLKDCSKGQQWEFALHIRRSIMNLELSDNNYRSLAAWLVRCQDYEGAIWAAETYINAGGTEVRAFSSLAMGYLYSGEEAKAMAIYEAHLDDIDSRDRTGREIFIRDLRRTGNLDVQDPEAVARVRTWLEE